jgi:hypothetical protein
VDCPNRKPRPGFILTALERFGARTEDCLLVGDSSIDRLAAEAAGVTFRWADLFFGRPIDRGMQMPGGRWGQVRQAEAREWADLVDLAGDWPGPPPTLDPVERAGSLALIARERGAPVGWLTLVRGETEREADLAFGALAFQPNQARASEGPEGLKVVSPLLECALDWARAQEGLERLCVQVQADNLPVSRLCCRFGFVERPQVSLQKGDAGDIQLDCSL